MELSTLIERCQQGDDLAWEALVRQFQGRVFGFTLHFFRDREEARDAAQEVFVKVYQRLDTVQTDVTFVAWLLRLARNHCIDRQRRLKVRKVGAGVAIEDAPEIEASEPTPEEGHMLSERQRLVYRALGRMSDNGREMILLKDIQQMKLEEIAALLALPLNTVKSRSRRARLELARTVLELEPNLQGSAGQALAGEALS